jgi:hypothetical protein
MDIISIILGFAVGGVGVFGAQKVLLGNKIKQRMAEAETEAERVKKERMLQAKRIFLSSRRNTKAMLKTGSAGCNRTKTGFGLKKNQSIRN